MHYKLAVWWNFSVLQSVLLIVALLRCSLHMVDKELLRLFLIFLDFLLCDKIARNSPNVTSKVHFYGSSFNPYWLRTLKHSHLFYMICCYHWLHHQVVDVYFHPWFEFVCKHFVDKSLICGSCVLRPKHHLEAICDAICDKCHFLPIIGMHHDLIVTWKSIHQTE